MATWIMKAFLVGYLICAGVCMFEKKYILGMYWIGAVVLNAAVILMDK
jgi:hypothetical protein